ncbi:MAG: DedA family protein [Thiotrichales bacterium]
MISPVTTEILDAIYAIELSRYAPLGIALLMMLESNPFTGLLLPGIIITTGLGSLSSTDYLGFSELVIFGSLGALLGDSIDYWLGYKGFSGWLFKPMSQTHKAQHKKILELVQRHGAYAAFVGRFLWLIHPLVPFMAGTSRIPPLRFYLADIPAAILWVCIYAALGHWGTRIATWALLS